MSLAVRTPVRSDVFIWCSASLLIKKVKEKEKENRRRFSFYLKEQLGSVHLVSIFVLFKVQIKCVCVCVCSRWIRSAGQDIKEKLGKIIFDSLSLMV